eukprot:UN28200
MYSVDDPSILKTIIPDRDENISQKNWGLFEYDNELYALYSIRPFIIMSIDPITRYSKTEYMHDFPYLPHFSFQPKYIIHVGMPPIMMYFKPLHRNVLLVATHTISRHTNDPHGNNIWYLNQLIIFDDKPPFRPLLVSRSFRFSDDFK